MSPLLLLLAAFSASAAPTISAEQIEISAGVVVGDGGVVAESGNLSITGARFELVEGQSLVVEQGRLTSPTLGVVTFERAELDLVSEELVIIHGALSGREDHLQLSGDELKVSREGGLTATKISVTACECEG